MRFPTSRELDGSDAVNTDPDYSAAYLVVGTDADDGIEGHGFVFTTGRGTEVQVAAIDAVARLVVGRPLSDLLDDPRSFSRRLVQDTQLRWLGPEKGVIHMACGAVLNALWDLAAKVAGLPLWQYLSRMPPEQLVAMVDFQYLSDALEEDEALELLRRQEPTRPEREALLLRDGFPAYTTTPGWLGYTDDKLARLARQAVAEGFELIKLKVGGSLDDDVRRMALARQVVGPDVAIAIDANQKWDVKEAVRWVTALAPYDPYWIEEPTSTDDVLGHAAIRRGVSPVRVATGENVANRVVFKQLLQADAIDILQLDATRVGGVNEIVANVLLAAKFGVPVCPHAGGVGLCELVQHFAMFDFVAVSGSTDGRYIEFVDHLHEHFVNPVVVEHGRYLAPRTPGFSAQIHQESLTQFAFPDGPEWADADAWAHRQTQTA